MLLCDAAQAAEGKLYVLGGGFSHVYTPNAPATMALAILIAVPWNRANEQHNVQAALVTGDGQQVQMGDAPIMAGGDLEVGRPPGLRAGTQLNTSLVFNFNGLILDIGDYVWELQINGNTAARAPFRVDNPPMTG